MRKFLDTLIKDERMNVLAMKIPYPEPGYCGPAVYSAYDIQASLPVPSRGEVIGLIGPDEECVEGYYCLSRGFVANVCTDDLLSMGYTWLGYAVDEMNLRYIGAIQAPMNIVHSSYSAESVLMSIRDYVRFRERNKREPRIWPRITPSFLISAYCYRNTGCRYYENLIAALLHSMKPKTIYVENDYLKVPMALLSFLGINVYINELNDDLIKSELSKVVHVGKPDECDVGIGSSKELNCKKNIVVELSYI
ncbi:MAG: hypothetical protein JZD41_02390 [Thermoproteus sp.]|nr:hypothetical protein [Thermoproteus sp.]